MKAKIKITNGFRKDLTDPFVREILLSCILLEGTIEANDRIVIADGFFIKINDVEPTSFKDAFNLIVKREDYGDIKIHELYSKVYDVMRTD